MTCSVQWKNQFYFFGGWFNKRQVSMLSENRLERKTTLGFNYDNGACTVLNGQTIVLCSGYAFWLCHKSNNPLASFTSLPKGNFDHFWTEIASIDGKNRLIRFLKTKIKILLLLLEMGGTNIIMLNNSHCQVQNGKPNMIIHIHGTSVTTLWLLLENR